MARVVIKDIPDPGAQWAMPLLRLSARVQTCKGSQNPLFKEGLYKVFPTEKLIYPVFPIKDHEHPHPIP